MTKQQQRKEIKSLKKHTKMKQKLMNELRKLWPAMNYVSDDLLICFALSNEIRRLNYGN